MIFFSIIIPTFNRAHSIDKAIKSLLNQTFQDFEIIIIDDSSSDNTFDVIKSIEDNRIVYFKNSQNQERCISRNKAIDIAKGEYICFLDSDDYHLTNHLETIYNSIKINNFTKAFYFVNAWNETEEGQRTERTCPDFNKYDPFTYFLHFTVNPQRWAVHNSIFEKVKFDPEVIICEDMDTSLRIAAKGYPIIQINERTTVYVAAADSFTHGDKNKWEKELFYLKRIFSKKELLPFLPKKEKNRLISMCYFHISQKCFGANRKLKTILNGLISLFYFPNGYNGKTNKILFVSILYSIPIVSSLIRFIKKMK